jgi:hypothetical protein
MATQNAIGTQKPIEVANGGTGASTLTDHGVLVGSGAGAVTPLTVGASGELLVGATTSDPAFATSADGNFTFTSATAATNRTLTVNNTDNTDTGSSATVQLTSGGTSAGDVAVKFTVTGTNYYSMGIDNSDSDKLKISNSTSLGTTDSWTMTTAGERTMPLQPAFLAYLSATASDVTGDGTSYTIVFNTEVFDQSDDYNNSTGIFTASVTGRYFLSAVVQLVGDVSGGTESFGTIVTSNRLYYFSFNPTLRRLAGYYGANNCITYSAAVVVDMDASDTAKIQMFCQNGSKVNDIYGGEAYTYFSGYLAV